MDSLGMIWSVLAGLVTQGPDRRGRERQAWLVSTGQASVGMAGKAGWGQETIGKARQERLVLSWKGEMEEAQATMFRDPPRAVFSDDRRYRYRLWRVVEGAWSERRKALMIGLNPSVADENVLDPTLRRFLGFCRVWGVHRMEVVNLFALVSTDPRGLYAVKDPTGPANDLAIDVAAVDADIIVACWGAHPMAVQRASAVMQLLAGKEVKCFGLTADGAPKHPLYLPKMAELQPFELA